jgi:hypothetical protein
MKLTTRPLLPLPALSVTHFLGVLYAQNRSNTRPRLTHRQRRSLRRVGGRLGDQCNRNRGVQLRKIYGVRLARLSVQIKCYRLASPTVEEVKAGESSSFLILRLHHIPTKSVPVVVPQPVWVGTVLSVAGRYQDKS